MLAIQVAPEENSQVAEWKARGGYSIPVLLVPAAASAEPSGQDYAAKRYGVLGEPTDLLLDAAHKVVFRHMAAKAVALEAEIRDLLGLPPFEGLEQEGSPERR